jgi:hypothetical protein
LESRGKRRQLKAEKCASIPTVTETNIRYPTDSSLLSDGVRVLTRTMRRIAEIGGEAGERVRDRMRSVGHRVMGSDQGATLPYDVHASDKIVSLFETATQIIRKGKSSKPQRNLAD